MYGSAGELGRPPFHLHRLATQRALHPPSPSMDDDVDEDYWLPSADLAVAGVTCLETEAARLLRLLEEAGVAGGEAGSSFWRVVAALTVMEQRLVRARAELEAAHAAANEARQQLGWAARVGLIQARSKQTCLHSNHILGVMFASPQKNVLLVVPRAHTMVAHGGGGDMVSEFVGLGLQGSCSASVHTK